MCGHCTADLRLCFACRKILFSQEAAHSKQLMQLLEQVYLCNLFDRKTEGRNYQFCAASRKNPILFILTPKPSLHGNSTPDQCLCFRGKDNTVPQPYESLISYLRIYGFCDGTTRVVSYLFGNPKIGFPST